MLEALGIDFEVRAGDVAARGNFCTVDRQGRITDRRAGRIATDLRHERPVALKVLKPELAAVLGPERFLREVKIAAQLTHPHILPLHDSGNAGGLLYYVMPLIDGETLRARLTISLSSSESSSNPKMAMTSCKSL